MNIEVNTANVLFYLRLAMLGEVFPRLRRVTVEFTSNSIKFYAYTDGELDEEDKDSLSCIETELIAAFHPDAAISYEIVRSDYPKKINDDRFAVFARRERFTSDIFPYRAEKSIP